IILGVCALQFIRFSGFERLEWMTYDWRVRLAHRHSVASNHDATNLALVEISDNTIAAVNSGTLGFKYGLYWPREVYARALHELSNQGAKAVAFDVLFAELRSDHPPVKLPDGTLISSDEDFAQQIKASGNVILGADQDVLPARFFRRNAWAVGNISVKHDPDGVLRRVKVFQDYRVWHPFIEQVAAEYDLDLSKTIVESNKITFIRQRGDEPIVFPTDDSGQIATTNLAPLKPGIPEKFLPMTTRRVWAMGILLAARELDLDLEHPTIQPRRIILHGPNGLVRAIPVDRDGFFYVDWAFALNDESMKKGEGSLEELLEGYLERANGQPVTNLWAGKLVVIGSTATGNELADLGATPLENATFLVTKHLNVANSVIMGRFVRMTPLPMNLLLIIFVGSFAAWVTWVVARPYTGSLLMLAFVVAYIGGAFLLFAQFRISAPIILPLCCAGIVTHVVVITQRVRVEQMEKRRVKQLFSRLVSPDVVNEVLAAPTLSLGGIRREVTVYFADVRGFTELTDVTHAQAAEHVRKNNLNPADAESYYDAQARETLRTISLYLGTIADIVKQQRGLLDKYIGDCVMAFWGAPVANPQHAADAVRAAIDAQLALAKLNEQRAAQNKRLEEESAARVAMGLAPHTPLPMLSMGTGINTGLATVGYMGSETHLLNYTAFGREVNLASRLEGVSGHGRIIIGETTFAALKRDDPKLAEMCREWPPRVVKGFREAVRIYEVLWRGVGNHPPPPTDDTSELRAVSIAKPS
ncbi:MAG TPA: adenylate/guanylate cyclase domain-containing protein, partial [Verrucomicrobiae bacterium]